MTFFQVTAATNLYQKMFDGQLIKERTSHSSDAVRSYKRTSELQLKEISHALQPSMPSEPLDIATKPAECSGVAQPEVKCTIPTKSGESAANCRIKITRGDLSLDLVF